MSNRERYRITISRSDEGRLLAIDIHSVGLEDREFHVSVNGTKAPYVATPLHSVLRLGGITSRQWAGSRPIELDQVTGAQVQLLLRAVKPVRRVDRIEEIAEGISQMSREEASYWHAKADQPGGLASLRVLLAAGRRK